MSLRPKSEVAEIQMYLADLKKAAWLGESRSWWPNFLFHCTDILNAVNILRQGEFLSRVRAEQTGQLLVDIASADIIANTEAKWQDCVRLYFRPRTPTQFNNEGFRPIGQWRYDAHCPVPVYFLLDAESVLGMSNSLFTDGNVAAGAIPSSTVDQLKQIPFEAVYHDTWFDPTERASIVYHRNAEVLINERLGLGPVRLICCRSQAEYETLLQLLPPGVLAKWVDKIGVRPSLHLFHNRWTFLRQVDMSDQHLLFRFNGDTETPGPFDARVEIIEQTTGRSYVWKNDQFQANDSLNLSMHNVEAPQDYYVRLFFDDQLAFAGHYQEETLPF